MSLTDLLQRLEGLEIRLWVEDGSLRFSAPQGALDQPLIDEIRGRKPELIETLSKARDGVVTVKRDGALPLSPHQARLWFLQRLSPETRAFNSGFTIRLTGPVQPEVLESVLSKIVERHEILRTAYTEEAFRGVQTVHPPMPVLLTAPPSTMSEAEALEAARSFMAQDLDLSDPLQLKALWIPVSDGEGLLSLAIHHIGFDGASARVMIGELLILLEAQRTMHPPELGPVKIQYGDYAVWAHEQLGSSADARSIERWQVRLEGSAPVLPLPYDHSPSGGGTSKGGSVRTNVSSEVLDGIRRLAGHERSTLFMALLTGFYSHLHRITGETDLVVGTPLSVRPEGTENSLGFFVNALPLRTTIEGDRSFRDLLLAVRDTTLEAFQDGDVALSALVEALRPERDTSTSPLFRVLFVFEDHPQDGTEQGRYRAQPVPIGAVEAQFDLTLTAKVQGNRLTLNFDYPTALFSETTIHRFLAQLVLVLEAMASDPDRALSAVSILSEEDRRFLEVSNQTHHPTVGSPFLHGGFEARARAHPDAIAIVQEQQSFTYGELDAWSNRLAAYLLCEGLGVGALVAIALKRTPEWVATSLAILKIGGTYLPIDPAYPKERIRHLLQDSEADFLVTTEALYPRIPDTDVPTASLSSIDLLSHSPRPPDVDLDPTSPAYVIYTSGSTGAPKGVVVEHRSAAHFVEFAQSIFGLDPRKRMLQFTGLSFDPSVHEIFATLSAGAVLILSSDEVLDSTAALLELCRTSEVNVLSLPTALWHQLASDVALRPTDLPTCVETVVIGGEQVRSNHLSAWLDVVGDRVRLINLYGPTECSIASTWHLLDDDSGFIGRPIWNARCYITDAYGNPTPVGVPGELYIAGVGVARGYLNQPELTKRSFIPEPGRTGGERMYRTGDLVRMRSDGVLEFLGRADDQVKIRGFRVELGEVESILGQHPDVRDAVVTAIQDRATGGTSLAAYIVARKEPAKGSLLTFLAAILPAHMIPSSIDVLERIPLTVNGKVDRGALPVPTHQERDGLYTPPTNRTEEALSRLWSEVLGHPKIGTTDDFFDLGGHSLSALRLVSLIRNRLGLAVTVRDLFQFSTIGGLASIVPSVEALPRRFPVPQESRARVLAPQQEGLWFLWQVDPQSAAFNVSLALRFEGALDRRALGEAFQHVVDRHQALRTRFEEVDGLPFAHVSEALSVSLGWADLSADSPVGLTTRVREFLNRPFDLQTGPLVRGELIRFGEADHVFVVSVHHIVSDRASMSLIGNELQSYYNRSVGGEGGIQPSALEFHYQDYAARCAESYQSVLRGRAIEFWASRLKGAPDTPFMPTDHPRPVVRSSKGDTQSIALPADLVHAIEAMGREKGATPFMTHLALTTTLLSRYARQEDLLVGYPTDGRDSPDLDDLVGFFVDTVVHRADLSQDPSFVDVLERTRQDVLDGLQHRTAPFDRVVEAVGPARSASFNPLFQVMFSYGERPYSSPVFHQLETRHVLADTGAAQFDLTFNVSHEESGAKVHLNYATELFEPSSARRILENYLGVLQKVLTSPDAPLSSIDLFASMERDRRLSEWNDTTVEYPEVDSCLHQLFEAQTRRTPDAEAIRFAGLSLSYEEVDRGANRIANLLASRGVEPRTAVAVCLDRGLALPQVLLGIMKAGCAYVPLDPDLPANRIKAMLKEMPGILVITTSALAPPIPVPRSSRVILDSDDRAWERSPSSPPTVTVSNRDLAYIIFTSGSTGTPKGVMNEHRGITNRLLWMRDRHPLGLGERVLQKTPYSFDVSIWEFFWPLISGGTLVLAEPDGHKDPFYLIDLIADEKIVNIHFVPSMLKVFLATRKGLERCLGLKKVFCSGEALTPELVGEFFAHFDCELHNFYGPTEAGIEVSSWVCNTGQDIQAIPIGKPTPNSRLYVLDAAGHPCSVGIPGELHIAGVQVARGYFQQPELTGRAFVSDPFIEDEMARMYRTGDLAKWREDGALEFLGRMDHQVKVRGFRVECGEVESALVNIEGIAQATVLVRTTDSGDALVAYVVPRKNSALVSSEIRRDLGEELPSYMVPSLVVVVDKFPLTTSGKVDRGRLPAAEALQLPASIHPEELSPAEQLVADVWQEVLGLETVSASDNFFDLGGHSLQSIVVLSKLETLTGCRLAPRSLMLQTLGQVADEIHSLRVGSGVD